MKVAAIVPALNEEANIGRVLEVLLKSKDLQEVLVVDGGSKDKTVDVARKMGVKAVIYDKCPGKGEAMKKGIEATDAGIVVFFDADLIGLREDHVSSLVRPVVEEGVAMACGVRIRYGGLPALMIKLDPLLAIGGERAMRRSVFEAIPLRFLHGFAVETALNYYCIIRKLPVKYVPLRGLNIIIKEKKWGFWKGFLNRIMMSWQLFKIRFTVRLGKKDFK